MNLNFSKSIAPEIHFKFIRIIFLAVIAAPIAFLGYSNNPFLSVDKVEVPWFHGGSDQRPIYELNTNFALFNLCKEDIEGYSEMLSGSEYFGYPSLRDDISVAMIARATTGKMGFDFLTGKVPKEENQPEVSFFFLSDIDLNNRQPFDIKVNDQSLLTFNANEDGTLSIMDNPGNGHVSFNLVERDRNRDGIGALRITVPISLINKGKQQQIGILGHKKGSNSWIMIFKATDVIQRLKKSVMNEASFIINQRQDILELDAPAHFAGKEVYLISDGLTSKKTIFKKQADLAKASIKISPPKHNLIIVYGDESMEIKIKEGESSTINMDIKGVYLYHHTAIYKEAWYATMTKWYKPEFFETYNDFFERKYDDGLVSIMNSSHQDIAWVDRPEICIILRDTLLLTPVIHDALVREDYGFDIEDGLMLREYLDRHPDSKENITELLNRKLMSVGASYNCPYEDMYDAEDQVRQLYLGKKWVKNTFGGYDSKVYWNVDVPGKTLQQPQILKKAGVDYMVISRHAKSMFRWESPDGSSVFTYSPGHYGNDVLSLSKDMNNKVKYGSEQVLFWRDNFQNSKGHTPLLSSQDMLPAVDYSDFITTWNGFDKVQDEDGNQHQVHLPKMELMTVDEFMPLAEKNATNIETIKGERPNVWVYIHGPGHHEAITASREASKLLPSAEKFLSVANVIDPQKMPYPYETLDEAWQSKIFPDHGWGGHDGDITDNLFKEKLVKSRFMSQELLDKGIEFIARRIKTQQTLGLPLVLFNSLSWERTDPVTVSINLVEAGAKSLQIVTADNQTTAAQTTNLEYHHDGSIKKADITFIAEQVPSIGYKTYYLKTSDISSSATEKQVTNQLYENDGYRISFEKGGIAQIYDKEFDRNLLKEGAFSGGEVFTMRSVGNGAGEFGDIQQPSMDGFDQVSVHGAAWKIVENGSVFTTYRIRQQLEHNIVEQDVTIYHDLKRILFETRLLNWSGELFREFRTAFPINMQDPAITYEVPFGQVEVGIDEIQTAGERYTPLCKDVHPRAIMDWIAATDDEVTVTLSSSVAAADWIDPTSENKNPVLQHLLLASRVSCHGAGNEYSQEGSHSYYSIFTSNKSDSREGQRIAKQKNEPIRIVINPDMSSQATLSESISFFTLNQENIIVSTIKKAEDSDDYIIRMYDTEGKESVVSLRSFFNLDSVQQTNIIEENPRAVSEMKVGKYGIETFSMRLMKK